MRRFASARAGQKPDCARPCATSVLVSPVSSKPRVFCRDEMCNDLAPFAENQVSRRRAVRPSGRFGRDQRARIRHPLRRAGGGRESVPQLLAPYSFVIV